MARDWFLRNRNTGNVLKTEGRDINSTGNITPDANMTVLNVDLVSDITLTGFADESIPGDFVVLAIQNNTGSELTLTLDGDFAAASLTVSAAEVASAMIVYNGQNFASIVAA